MSTKGERDERRRWIEASPLPGITGTARWDLIEAQTNPRVKKELVVPIFVELLPETARMLDEFVQFLEKASDQYSLPDHVMDRLQSEAGTTRADDGPLQLTLLSRPDSVENRFWRVVSVGPPQARSFRRDGFSRGRAQSVKTGPLRKTPVVGIIDDAIGFLNHRFRRADGTTRFERLWIMHNDVLASNPGPHDAGTLNGIELSTAHINHRLASGRSELALYRQVNSGVFGPATRHGTAFHAGHGTHVLDLAAGADAGEDMAGVPILAVQLPPTSIGETSGAALDPDVVRGLDWIVTQALQMPGRFPLVINLSLGSLAGPQDATSLVERWIAAEIKRYHHFSGHAPIRVVVAYGNAYRSRLVARAMLAPGDEISVDWRILPDDATKSVLELRTNPGQSAQLGLTIDPPDGGMTLPLAQWPAGGTVLQYLTPGGVAAEVMADPELNFDKTLVTVAPTTRSDPRPAACSGNWKVTVRNAGVNPARLSLKVQRDDTPGGYRRNGRQSWLDHPDGWTWEDETRAYTQPAANGPVTRRGTGVGYAGLVHPSVYFAGAARPDLFVAGTVRPSAYTAMARRAQFPDSPTVSAMGDEGSALTGLRAAGVLSGSTARLSGTSMAAPQTTRALLIYALGGGMTANMAGPHDPAELAALLQTAPAAVPDRRLGLGTVPAT